MDENEVGFIPQSLDASERFLWWDLDQLVLFLFMMGIGIQTGYMLSGMMLGGTLAWQYGRMKSGKHSKFALHLMYWWLPSAIFPKMKTLPPSDVRHFLG